jgi:hypothetical protein
LPVKLRLSFQAFTTSYVCFHTLHALFVAWPRLFAPNGKATDDAAELGRRRAGLYWLSFLHACVVSGCGLLFLQRWGIIDPAAGPLLGHAQSAGATGHGVAALLPARALIGEATLPVA